MNCPVCNKKMVKMVYEMPAEELWDKNLFSRFFRRKTYYGNHHIYLCAIKLKIVSP